MTFAMNGECAYAHGFGIEYLAVAQAIYGCPAKPTTRYPATPLVGTDFSAANSSALNTRERV